MATNVTVAGGSETQILLPFTTAQNAAAAQAAVNMINLFTNDGLEQIDSVTNVNGAVSLPGTAPFLGGVNVTGDAGTQTFLGLMPASYNLLVNSSSGFVAAIGGADTEVFSSGSGTLAYYNTSTDGQIFLGGGGGVAAIFEADSGAAATVNLDGQAEIDGTLGSTTVNAYGGSFTYVVEGAGNVSIVAQAGQSVIDVAGSNPTATVTVSGTAGSTVTYVPGSGSAFINPGAGDILVAAGAGSETLFGGAATIGGQAMNAPDFTGRATVFGGLGYFEGGSAGDNVLLTGTVAGATTLVGGGNGDILFGYGVNDSLVAGTGNETLIGSTGTPTLGGLLNTTAGGEIFATGNGSNAATYVYGNQSGADTIALGSGSATIALGHQTVAGGISSVSGNTIIDQAGITTGSATLLGFAAQAYGWAASDQIQLAAGVTATFSNDGNGNEVATLSNGSTITFSGISETSQYNVTTHSNAGGTYIS